MSAQEAIAIGKLVQQNDAFLMEGCKYLHHPAIRKLEVFYHTEILAKLIASVQLLVIMSLKKLRIIIKNLTGDIVRIVVAELHMTG